MSDSIKETTTYGHEAPWQFESSSESILAMKDSLGLQAEIKAEIEENKQTQKTWDELAMMSQNIESKQSFCDYMNEKWTPLESQSQEIQNLTQQILWPQENEFKDKQSEYNEIKSNLIDGIKARDRGKISDSVKKLLDMFFGWFTRKMNIGRDITYTPNENDRNYLINAISATLDPEKRSELTYLLWKIKDEEIKQNLKEKWVENPSQFQLFLQNCKPWQLILTNGESKWASRHAKFSSVTQIVSWARWCHAAVISDIKEENWIITDATIVQATWKWIEETSLKESFKKTYKNSDLLLWTFQPPEKWNDVVNSCKNYIWWKYSQINLVADTILDTLHISKQKRNKYCSELVFTWMEEAWLELPDPHTTPADLLSTNAITPEYCCYCESFS